MEANSTKEVAPLAGEAKANQLIAIREKYKGDNSGIQRIRILEGLRLGPVSTFEARNHLDIVHPAGRIQELREDGYVIETLRHFEPSESGKRHSIAVYVLRMEAQP
jgi:hypothetical protein